MSTKPAPIISFEFDLLPIDSIHPWGTGDELSLHWFGLTNGNFWIKAGDVELFRYSAAIIEHWKRLYPDDFDQSPYFQYPVVRNWEDMLEILPDILDPIPADLAEIVSDAISWSDWLEAANCWQENASDDAWDIYYTAARWWSNRHLNSSYMKYSPGIWFWRVDDTIHVRWDNRKHQDDGIQIWQAQIGEITMPVDRFIRQMTTFDTHFLAAMAKRVAEARSGWSRPKVSIDLDDLERQQLERSTWLAPALKSGPREYYDWDDVRRTIAHIENEIKPAF